MGELKKRTQNYKEVAGVKWATENYREGDKEHFTWEEAMAINVPGWRLPTSNDVCSLIRATWMYEPCADGMALFKGRELSLVEKEIALSVYLKATGIDCIRDGQERPFWIANSVSGDEAEALSFDAYGIGLRLLPKDRKLRIRLIKCSEDENTELSKKDFQIPKGLIHAPFTPELPVLPNDPTSDNVNHPSHYTSHPSGVECIEITKHFDFCVGNAIKYLWRCGLKQEQGMTSKEKEIEDMRKAIWYINKKIEMLEK